MINFNNQAATEENTSLTESRMYDEMTSNLVALMHLSESGISVSNLKQKNDRNEFSGNPRFPDKKTIDKAIESLMKSVSNISYNKDDEVLDNALNTIVTKYSISNMNELVTKLNEFIVKDDCLKKIADSVNKIAPSVISDTNSLATYVSNLVQSFAAFNSTGAFVNVNDLINENAMLKAQIVAMNGTTV